MNDPLAYKLIMKAYAFGASDLILITFFLVSGYYFIFYSVLFFIEFYFINYHVLSVSAPRARYSHSRR